MNILILAGGSGTRLWPLSRDKYPKQLLTLLGEKTMIQETASRVEGFPVFVITGEDTASIIHDQLSKENKNFTKKNIFVEPSARNTAPAIAYAASFFQDDEIIAVLPSDHSIAKEEIFVSLLKKAEDLAKKGFIVTFGIVPERPETGYGYIKTKKEEKDSGFLVDSFKEKPDVATASRYIQEGNYYWNAGMFVFQAGVMREELKKYSPEIYAVAEKIGNAPALKQEYDQFPSISIDYAVMEKTDKLVLIPADIGWNDIGGFEALWENLKKDKEGNALKGNIDFYPIESKNNLFYTTGEKKIVAAIGIQDLIVVDTEDALLISDKKESQKVKDITLRLKKENREEAFLHKKVYRPWGYYKVIQEEPDFKLKEVFVYPLSRLSLQSHNRRSESWTVVEGEGIVVLGEKEISVQKESMVFIPMKEKHRLINLSKNIPLKIIEVQMGNYLGEDDIVRYEDDYGRHQ